MRICYTICLFYLIIIGCTVQEPVLIQTSREHSFNKKYQKGLQPSLYVIYESGFSSALNNAIEEVVYGSKTEARKVARKLQNKREREFLNGLISISKRHYEEARQHFSNATQDTLFIQAELWKLDAMRKQNESIAFYDHYQRLYDIALSSEHRNLIRSHYKLHRYGL